MKRIVLILLAAAALAACKGRTEVEFSEKDGVWIPDAASVEDFAESLKKADAATACAMIDEVFTLADSLSGTTSETVERLSDGLLSALVSQNASVQDYELVDAVLDREAVCSVLGPLDYRRLDFKRGRLNLNRPGFAVNDFPVISEDGKEYRLRDLFTKRTVLFVYGAECAECSRQMDRIAESSFIKKVRKDSSLNLVALYSGEDIKEFLSASAR